MFKALVLTEKLITHPQSTLYRQIISQQKQQVEYSPTKSPTKPLESSSGQKRKQPKSSQKNPEPNQIHLLKLTQIEGSLKIFHQYQLQRIEDNFNKFIIEKKRQQIATLAHLKTNILAIMNVNSEKNKDMILGRLSEVKQEIDAVDLFVQKSMQTSEKLQFSTSFSIVVYFRTSLMSEEFYKLSYKQFLYLPIYLKQVIILERQSTEEISYKEVLSSFKYIEPISEQNQHKLSLTEKDINLLQGQQRKWIELPKCIDCLLKLEFQVSGIDQKVLYIISQSRKEQKEETPKKVNSQNSLKQSCLTCQILSNHRKEGEMLRKLSYESSEQKSPTKPDLNTHCDDCKEKSDIWICMVCSRVGCGRYKNADAYKHFVKSGHIITIDLETERVWNYMSDCFSHKLLKNINQAASSVRFPELSQDQSEKIEQSKLEAAFWQYCSVFSQQMERQRIFYENIKISEEEKFHQEDAKLNTIIKELQKENQQKSLQLKRTMKKKGKTAKKLKELEEKVIDQREILKEHEECLSADWLKNFLENDEDIKKKKRQLQELDLELNQVLAELSST